MIIGICGKAGSGKDTIGDYLIDNYEFTKISLADPLKRLVQDVFVVDDHTMFDRKAREEELKLWPGWSVRKLLQYIGTELFRDNIDDSIWVKSLYYRILEEKKNPETENRNYVITDIRFPNELQFLSEKFQGEFTSIRVVRDGYDGSVGIQGHKSESYTLETDHVILNNKTIDELHHVVDKFLAFGGDKWTR